MHDAFYVPGDTIDELNTSPNVLGYSVDVPNTSATVPGDAVDVPDTSPTSCAEDVLECVPRLGKHAEDVVQHALGFQRGAQDVVAFGSGFSSADDVVGPTWGIRRRGKTSSMMRWDSIQMEDQVDHTEDYDLPFIGLLSFGTLSLNSEQRTNISNAIKELLQQRHWIRMQHTRSDWKNLYTHDNLSRNLTGGKLDKKDLQFIQKRRIRMSLPAESRLCSPTVLIGCDQLWKFIKFEAPQLSLPSGHDWTRLLVPTRFGYMISGRRLQRAEQRTDSRNSSVNKALKSSCAFTEHYWKIWKDQYLKSLREQHRQSINNKAGCAKIPRIGEVVLLSDPVLKRNQWKMGRIVKTIASGDGAVCETEVIHNRKVLRRPVCQLFPLEIRSDDNSATSQEQTLDDQQMKKPTEPFRRYNLRTRKATVQLTRNSTPDSTTSTRSTRTWPLSLYVKMALTLILINTVNGQAKNDQMFKDIDRHKTNYSIECNPKGVYFHAPEIQEYELCVKSYYMNGKIPPVHQLLRLPPEECSTITKQIGSSKAGIECWPLAAIFGLGASLYAIIALCYMICYVPVTIGHPLRIILRGACKTLSTSAWCILMCIRYFMLHVLRKDQRHRSSRVLQALAVVCLIQGACSCQLVNIFSHHLQNCRVKEERTVCDMEVASVIKINPFKQEACLKFRRNDSDIWDVRLSWKGLNLHCNQESLLYTRKVEQKVIDSKRCPHMGSCIGNKCADVNASSLLPELAVGNSYPGITGCIESCGGPGCDCFYLSSGCLFYRIYAVPKDDEVYEIFRCITWKEIVKLRLDITDVRSKKLRSYVLSVHPNVPQHVHNMDVTVSLISPGYYLNGRSERRKCCIWAEPPLSG
ncbi:unnamed protein product [Heligmosomoides polygyrus]|uniref:DUF5641 domain-containing protein n=1 Tax=Heligmosomoides polygyrus TaxID=6339 RepID=A0A3P8A991_HELPZ|nr:unnamed protein product [Heligmosomoides polygyrus]